MSWKFGILASAKTRAIIAVSLLLSGCFVLPTPADQIVGNYVSEDRYAAYECGKLGHKLEGIRAKEAEYASLHERTRAMVNTASGIGATLDTARYIFYAVITLGISLLILEPPLHHGTGDGFEALQLARVRGEREAIERAFDLNGCTA